MNIYFPDFKIQEKLNDKIFSDLEKKYNYRLKDREKKFIVYYSFLFNLEKAAKMAGYKNAPVSAQYLKKKPIIAEAISHFQEKQQKQILENGRILKPKEIQILLSNFALNEEISVESRLKALEMLSKQFGLFIERHENSLKIEYENVNATEFLKMMKNALENLTAENQKALQVEIERPQIEQKKDEKNELENSR